MASEHRIEQYWLGSEPYILITLDPDSESMQIRSNLPALGIAPGDIAQVLHQATRQVYVEEADNGTYASFQVLDEMGTGDE